MDMPEPTTDVAPEVAAPLLASLVKAGAEIEQRHLDGAPVDEPDEDGRPNHIWPLAPDEFDLETEPDEPDALPTVWFLPLYVKASGPADDGSGRTVFDGDQHRFRPLMVTRFDILAEGNVGMSHPNGVYSVIRPISDATRAALADAWRQGPLLTG